MRIKKRCVANVCAQLEWQENRPGLGRTPQRIRTTAKRSIGLERIQDLCSTFQDISWVSLQVGPASSTEMRFYGTWHHHV